MFMQQADLGQDRRANTLDQIKIIKLDRGEGPSKINLTFCTLDNKQ